MRVICCYFRILLYYALDGVISTIDEISLYYDKYCLSVCLSVRLSICLSVRLFVTRVLCNETKEHTAEILIPHESSIYFSSYDFNLWKVS